MNERQLLKVQGAISAVRLFQNGKNTIQHQRHPHHDLFFFERCTKVNREHRVTPRFADLATRRISFAKIQDTHSSPTQVQVNIGKNMGKQ